MWLRANQIGIYLMGCVIIMVSLIFFFFFVFEVVVSLIVFLQKKKGKPDFIGKLKWVMSIIIDNFFFKKSKGD